MNTASVAVIEKRSVDFRLLESEEDNYRGLLIQAAAEWLDIKRGVVVTGWELLREYVPCGAVTILRLHFELSRTSQL